jgi:hypothetical protein
MKNQFLHEAHNRQDKAQKADYHDHLGPRRKASYTGLATSSSGDGNVLFTISLEFPDLKPHVTEALRGLEPNIDIPKLINALRSEASGHKSQLRRSSLRIPRNTVEREERKLMVLLRKTKPGRFILWHNALPEEASSALPAVPTELRDWLRKFLPKQTGPVAPPASPLSDPSPPSGGVAVARPRPRTATTQCTQCGRTVALANFYSHIKKDCSPTSTERGKRVGKNIYLPAPHHAKAAALEVKPDPSVQVRDDTFYVTGLITGGGTWQHNLTRECPRCPRILKIVAQGPSNLPKYAADAARSLALAEHFRQAHATPSPR